MKWLTDLLAKLIPNLIKELVQKRLPSMSSGKSDGKTEKRLKKKINDLWIIPFILVFASCSFLAPEIRTIYVPERDAIMLRQDVGNVKIWAKAKDQPPVPGRMDLEEGWM